MTYSSCLDTDRRWIFQLTVPLLADILDNMMNNNSAVNVVSSSEAKNRFGAITKRVIQSGDDMVIEVYGKPAVVLVPYTTYERLNTLRQQERKRNVLDTLRALRREIRKRKPSLSAEDAYRQAGFGKEVIADTLKKDRELARRLS